MSETEPNPGPGTGMPALQPGDDWHVLTGRTVELWHENRRIRTSKVEDVAIDSSLMWLSFDGADTRQIITKFDGYRIYLVD